MKLRIAVLLSLLAFVPTTPVSAQGSGSLQEQIETLARENAERYIAPVADGLLNGLGSGFAGSGRIHKPLGFSLGLRGMVALPSATMESFVPVLPQSVDFQVGSSTQTFQDPYRIQGGRTETPTAVGEGDGIVLIPDGEYRNAIVAAGENPENYHVAFPEGLGLPLVPMALIQGAVGLPYGIELTGRIIPDVEVTEDIGAISAIGFGAKHKLSFWFPMLPVDLMVYGGWQKLEVGDYLTAETVRFGALASQGLGPLTVFGTVGRTSGDVTVTYTFENEVLGEEGKSVSFARTNDGSTPYGAGLSLNLLGLQVTGEYTFGDYPTATVQAGISIR